MLGHIKKTLPDRKTAIHKNVYNQIPMQMYIHP